MSAFHAMRSRAFTHLETPFDQGLQGSSHPNLLPVQWFLLAGGVMKPAAPLRMPSRLPHSLNHRLNMYALAASAAGVGMLVLEQSADAKIVYTRAHDVILRGSHLALDLNHDGITDFTINQRSGCTTDGGCTAALYADGAAGGNYIEGLRRIFNFAYALKPQARIGSSQPFMGNAMYYRFGGQQWSGSCTGSWVDVTNRYLGLRFIIKGETHFGWARLNVACKASSEIIGLVTGYAYETLPNQPILAGKTKGRDVVAVHPASLGQLARGAAAISSGAREGIPLWPDP
jgi:hypothetical protein